MSAPRFSSEIWEHGDEWIVTCDGRPVGMSLSRKEAACVARWLNTGSEELVPRIGITPEAYEAACDARDRHRHRVAELCVTFQHMHVAGEGVHIDKCRQCGLDIRDDIHLRLAKP